MSLISGLKVKLFADSADKDSLVKLAQHPFVRGFTTNPTLMRKAGVTDYRVFAEDILNILPRYPISFEVSSDDFAEMAEQAYEIASWGENVFVKIPITNTRGEFSGKLIHALSSEGIRLNITAILTLAQVEAAANCLSPTTSAIISVFAGRIADTGIDPVPVLKKAKDILKPFPHIELLWASPREILNVVQANEVGCDIITLTPELFSKLSLLGKNLEDYSLETVKMFYEDAQV